MKLIFTALFFLKSLFAIACVCTLQPDFKSKEDLKTYDFIALAEIKSLPLLGFRGIRQNGEIKITIKELFKGNPVTLVYDDFYNTDCAMTLHEGEQWLFFGTVYNDKMEVGSCTYARMYRDTTGKREWSGLGAIERLGVLRKLYGHTIATIPKEKIFYPNGKLEMEQIIKKNKLDGLRRIYYPSGQLYIAEKFKNGERVDYRDVYSVSGQLLQHVDYKNGLIKKITGYQDSTYTFESLEFEAKYKDFPYLDKVRDPISFKKIMDSLRKTIDLAHIINLKEFDTNGRSYVQENYYRTGKLRYKGYSDWDKQIREFYHYYEDGKLEYYTKSDFKNDQEIEYSYKQDGTKKDLINKCQFCMIYFNTGPPEAMPEKIFIE